MHMAVRRVVIMLGCDPLHLCVEPVFKGEECFLRYVPKRQVATAILPFWIRAYDKTIKDAAFLSLINHTVCLPSFHYAVNPPQRPVDPCMLFAWAVCNIPD